MSALFWFVAGAVSGAFVVTLVSAAITIWMDRHLAERADEAVYRTADRCKIERETRSLQHWDPLS